LIGRTRCDDGDSSKFVVAAIESIPGKGRLALDIPSGEGRHSRFLASRGFQVVSADLDLKALLRGVSASRGPNPSKIAPVRLDATKPLPFPPATFDLALIVHFQMDSILQQIDSVLKKDGFLVLETFGAQGENWRSLPRVNELRRQLEKVFHLSQYVERAVGKAPDRVTVRAVGRKM
jgi:SAM-dependent methyltransferase